jgi:hypothetical protein
MYLHLRFVLDRNVEYGGGGTSDASNMNSDHAAHATGAKKKGNVMGIKTYIFATTAAVLLGTVSASAVPIEGALNLTGSTVMQGTWDAPTGLDFPTGHFLVPDGIDGTGDLSFVKADTMGEVQDFLVSDTNMTDFFTVTVAATTLHFDLASITSVKTDTSPDGSQKSVTFFGTGQYRITGSGSYDPTAASISITTLCTGTSECTPDQQTRISFSADASASPVPEPASIALLGTGLCMLAMGLRKKKA